MKLEACLAAISVWKSANMFMFNQEKIELIIFKPKHLLKVRDKIELRVEGKIVHVLF